MAGGNGATPFWNGDGGSKGKRCVPAPLTNRISKTLARGPGRALASMPQLE